MINLLLFIFALICFGLAAAWLAENPGQVTMYWFDWRIDTSFAVLVAAILAGGLVIALSYLLVRAIIRGPDALSARVKLRQQRKGITELTYSVAALAASDTKGAEHHTRKAEKLLGRTPITLLLSAQVARQQADESKTRQLLEQLLDYPETEYLAARSLSEAASSQQALPRALNLAKRAHKVNPKEEAAIRSIVSLQIRLGKWEEALASLKRYGRKSRMGRVEMRRLEALIHFEHAHALLAGNVNEAALLASKKALGILPDFVPALLLVADCQRAAGRKEKAAALLKKAWKKTQHPHVTEKLKEMAGNDKKYAKLLKEFAQKRGDTVPLYQCRQCGHSQPHFAAHCPACSAFDSMG